MDLEVLGVLTKLTKRVVDALVPREKPYSGQWTVAKGMITVSLGTYGSKTTQLGGSALNPSALASIMLGELVTEHLAKQPGK